MIVHEGCPACGTSNVRRDGSTTYQTRIVESVAYGHVQQHARTCASYV